MTKKLKYSLLITLAAVCIACFCAFAGCKIGPADRDEVLKEYGGANVVYYANGGEFNENPAKKVSNLYFKAGGENGIPFFVVPEKDNGDDKSTGISVLRKDYDFMGWYAPATYADGDAHAGEVKYEYTPSGATEAVPVYPVKDENGNVVRDFTSDRPIFHREGVDEQIAENSVIVVPDKTKPLTSATVLKDDDVIIACADWRPTLKVKYILVCEEGDTFEDGGVTYKNGSELRADSFEKGKNSFTPTSMQPRAVKGATFLQTCLDKEMTKPIAAISRPEGENPEDICVYSQYIKGDWQVVKDAQTVKSMFSGLTEKDKQFYILNSVDCANVTITLRNATSNAVAKICGSSPDITLSNLNFNLGTTTAKQGSTFSILGNIGATFAMSDVHLNGINIAFIANGSVSVYGFASAIAEGATFTNVKISNVSIKVKAPTGSNLNPQTNMLFGGQTSDSDFLASHTGITVDGTNTIELTKDLTN